MLISFEMCDGKGFWGQFAGVQGCFGCNRGLSLYVLFSPCKIPCRLWNTFSLSDMPIPLGIGISGVAGARSSLELTRKKSWELVLVMLFSWQLSPRAGLLWGDEFSPISRMHLSFISVLKGQYSEFFTIFLSQIFCSWCCPLIWLLSLSRGGVPRLEC